MKVKIDGRTRGHMFQSQQIFTSASCLSAILKAMVTKYVITLVLLLKVVSGEELQNHLIADRNGLFHIFWSVDDDRILFEVQVASKGYVGFGFTHTGNMTGSDVVIGWVLPNGQAVFHDRHALGNYEPIIDTEQNYQLLNAYENETHTVLRFTRKLKTCDKDDDIDITDDTIKVMFAWHPDDPEDITGLSNHGPHHRGIKDIYLLSALPAPIQITDDITVWDVQMPNISVPAQLTTYWCLNVKLPPLSEPHYYIGYTVEITPGNEDLVHHFDMFECRGNTSRFEEKVQNKRGYQCVSSGEVAEPMECQPSIIIWAVGSKGQPLPEDVGIPVGEEYGGSTYFLVQMHYNNIERKPGIIDSSILRVYLTKRNMPKKAAMLQMYSNFDYTLLIPPQQPSFTIVCYCPSECTSKALPKEGITIFQVGLHTHLAGRKLSIRHFRDKKELKPISIDDSYNFNYQEMRHLKEPVVVMPGDMLMGTCVYSTMDRNETVVGGYGTDEEMCFFYLSYYPKTDLTICIGGPNYKEIYDYFGVEQIGEDNVHIASPASLKNQSMFLHEKYYDWTTVNEAKMRRMYSLQYEAVKNITCQGDPKDKETHTIVLVDFPTDIPPYIQPPDECENANINKSEFEIDKASNSVHYEHLE